MDSKSDDKVGTAYSLANELATSGRKLGSIVDELERRGFSKDVIVAALKRRFDRNVAENRREALKAGLYAIFLFLAAGVVALVVAAGLALGGWAIRIAGFAALLGLYFVGRAIVAMIHAWRHTLTLAEIEEAYVRLGGSDEE